METENRSKMPAPAAEGDSRTGDIKHDLPQNRTSENTDNLSYAGDYGNRDFLAVRIVDLKDELPVNKRLIYYKR